MAESSGGDNGVPSPRPPTDFPWTRTVTTGVPYGPWGGDPGVTAASQAAQDTPPASGSGSTWPGQQTVPALQTGPAQQTWPAQQTAQQVVRHGPGVPVTIPTGQGASSAQKALTAEQVWREGLPAGLPPPRRRMRQVAGTAISVALLAASGVVIFLRLYHGPFGVTGVTVTQQSTAGCTVDVTGRIDTTGATGTVSYQWVFQPQFAVPRPLSQSVAAGQNAVYVTASVQGHGHGTLAQSVTLQVLSPGPGRAAHARVVVNC